MVKMSLCCVVMLAGSASARGDAEAMLQSSRHHSVDTDKPVFAQTRSVALDVDTLLPTLCHRLPHSADLNFDNATLVSNNLGGKGPNLQDQPEIRLSGVRQGIDLVITADAAYKPKTPERNGKKGMFGNINLRSGTTAELTFAFQDTVTKEATEVPDFYFTWADIDGWNGTRTSREELELPAIQQWFVAENPEYLLSAFAKSNSAMPSHEVTLGVSSTMVTAGRGCDNPTNPMELKKIECKGQEVFQQRRAITVEYKSLKDFKVTLKASGSDKSSGRNFRFSGRSNLVSDCPRLEPDEFNVVLAGCEGFGDAVVEDCTNKDFFILKNDTNGFVAPTYQPDKYGSDDLWETVKVQASDDWKGACVAYVKTSGTCKKFCESNGKTCVRAMDDAHHQTAGLSAWLKTAGYEPTDCTLLPSGHTRQTQENNGCNQRWSTQICACN